MLQAGQEMSLESLFAATVLLGSSLQGITAATAGAVAQPQLDTDGGGDISMMEVSFRIRKELAPDLYADFTAKEIGTLTWVNEQKVLRIKSVTLTGDADPAWTVVCEELG